MTRDRALKILLVLVGLLFLAAIYPLVSYLNLSDFAPMMLSLYVTLGIFLLLAARNPSDNRSLIAFTAWSSFAHAATMAAQAVRNVAGRPELLGMGIVLVVIGALFIVLAPARRPAIGTVAAAP